MQFCASNGKYVTSIEQDDLKIAGGIQETVPSEDITAFVFELTLKLNTIANKFHYSGVWSKMLSLRILKLNVEFLCQFRLLAALEPKFIILLLFISSALFVWFRWIYRK